MASTKKTTTVLTPVDERETFVSLRKSFAENEQDVQEKLRTLYQLQETDNEIDKLVQLRGELPGEVKSLEDEIARLKAKRESLESQIEGYKQGIEAHEKDIDEIEAQREQYKTQIDNVANSREFDSLNKEIENLGYERDIHQKKINESKEAIDDCYRAIDRNSDRLGILEADLAAKQEELSNIVESTAKEEADLTARRNSFLEKLDERTISAYERIRKSTHNHLAVVTLFPKNADGSFGDACGGCFHTIIPQRLIDIASGKKLVICEHCGRIIVNPEA